MNPTRILAALAAAALMGISAPALAERINLSATLTGADEVPANDSAGVGKVEANYDTDTNLFTYGVSYTGLSGDATAAHFHGPAAPGENAPPVLPIASDALASPISGSATLDDTQEADLLAGKWYFNVHTAQHPDGEIRGQLLQTSMSSMESSGESSMMSSEMPSSEMSSSELSSVSSEVSSGLSSLSSDLSSDLSSLSSDLSSGVSSASSDLSSVLSSVSSDLPSVDISTSVSVSASASVSAP